VKGAANPRTGKANAEKVSKYLEDKLRAKVEHTTGNTVILYVLFLCQNSFFSEIDGHDGCYSCKSY